MIRPDNTRSFNMGKSIAIDWEGQNDPPVELPEIPLALDISLQACTSAFISGMDSMMKEGAKSFDDFRSGKIDEKQYTYRVVSKGTQGAFKSGAKTVTALSLKEGVKVVSKRFGGEMLKRFARSNAMTAIAYGIVDQGADTIGFYGGTLSEKDYKINTVENVGRTGGAISGAAAGAMLGSVVPGLGTGAGALIGGMMGMLGSMGGAVMGKSLGESWFEEEEKK